MGQGWVQQWVLLSSLNVATCGWGGGFIGYILQNTLANAIGTLPVFVIAIVAVVGGLMVTTRTTLKQGVQLTGRGYEWVRDRQQQSLSRLHSGARGLPARKRKNLRQRLQGLRCLRRNLAINLLPLRAHQQVYPQPPLLLRLQDVLLL